MTGLIAKRTAVSILVVASTCLLAGCATLGKGGAASQADTSVSQPDPNAVAMGADIRRILSEGGLAEDSSVAVAMRTPSQPSASASAWGEGVAPAQVQSQSPEVLAQPQPEIVSTDNVRVSLPGADSVGAQPAEAAPVQVAEREEIGVIAMESPGLMVTGLPTPRGVGFGAGGGFFPPAPPVETVVAVEDAPARSTPPAPRVTEPPVPQPRPQGLTVARASASPAPQAVQTAPVLAAACPEGQVQATPPLEGCVAVIEGARRF